MVTVTDKAVSALNKVPWLCAKVTEPAKFKVHADIKYDCCPDLDGNCGPFHPAIEGSAVLQAGVDVTASPFPNACGYGNYQIWNFNMRYDYKYGPTFTMGIDLVGSGKYKEKCGQNCKDVSLNVNVNAEIFFGVKVDWELQKKPFLGSPNVQTWPIILKGNAELSATLSTGVSLHGLRWQDGGLCSPPLGFSGPDFCWDGGKFKVAGNLAAVIDYVGTFTFGFEKEFTLWDEGCASTM